MLYNTIMAKVTHRPSNIPRTPHRQNCLAELARALRSLQPPLLDRSWDLPWRGLVLLQKMTWTGIPNPSTPPPDDASRRARVTSSVVRWTRQGMCFARHVPPALPDTYPGRPVLPSVRYNAGQSTTNQKLAKAAQCGRINSVEIYAGSWKFARY